MATDIAAARVFLLYGIDPPEAVPAVGAVSSHNNAAQGTPGAAGIHSMHSHQSLPSRTDLSGHGANSCSLIGSLISSACRRFCLIRS